MGLTLWHSQLTGASGGAFYDPSSVSVLLSAMAVFELCRAAGANLADHPAACRAAAHMSVCSFGVYLRIRSFRSGWRTGIPRFRRARCRCGWRSRWRRWRSLRRPMPSRRWSAKSRSWANISRKFKCISRASPPARGAASFFRGIKKREPNRFGSRVCAMDYAFLAISTSLANAAASLTARSASTLRLRSTPAFFRPQMNLE